MVLAPEHPTRLLPGDSLNATEELLVDVLYDPLYRLDLEMQPVPELAKALPKISKRGRLLEIPIKTDARFHSGEKVKAEDVRFSLQHGALALVPARAHALSRGEHLRRGRAHRPEEGHRRTSRSPRPTRRS